MIPTGHPDITCPSDGHTMCDKVYKNDGKPGGERAFSIGGDNMIPQLY